MTKSKMECSCGVLTQLKRAHARVFPRNNQCEMSTERRIVCSILGCCSEFTLSEGNAPNSPNIYIIGNKGVGKSSDSEGGQPQVAAVHPRVVTPRISSLQCALYIKQCTMSSGLYSQMAHVAMWMLTQFTWSGATGSALLTSSPNMLKVTGPQDILHSKPLDLPTQV